MKTKDSINWGFKEQVDGFVSGQCATLNQTPEVITICEEAMEKGIWTVLPQPVKTNAKISSFTWGASGAYMLSANSEVQDEAWNFIDGSLHQRLIWNMQRVYLFTALLFFLRRSVFWPRVYEFLPWAVACFLIGLIFKWM